MSIGLASASTFMAAGAAPAAAQAAAPDEGSTAFSADELRIDASSESLEAVGHVRIDQPPFYFTSDRLVLEREGLGLVLDGTGRLAFCPCLGTPLVLQFSGATATVPRGVVLHNPVLEVFGVPVAWLPILWLRSPDQVGLLPAELAWRGADGFFAGSGVHIPWRRGEPGSGLDLRAGGYAEGGVAVDVALRTPTTFSRVNWDRLHGSDGVTIGAGGASRGDADVAASGEPVVAWDVDALRGQRAVRATTQVDAAAQPFDRASADAQWRFGEWTLSSGVRTVALRGTSASDLGAWGPIVTAHRGDAVGSIGAYDVDLEGGQIAADRASEATTAAEKGATSFARGEANLLVGSRLGAVGSTLALRGFGDVADDGATFGIDGAAQARGSLALPLARAYTSTDAVDPWVHVTEPRVEVAALVTHTSGVLVVPAGPGMQAPSGAAWIAAAGWTNTLGRLGSRAALDVDVSGGAVVGDRGAMPVMRVQASAGGPYLALAADVARVFTPPSEADGGGGAVVASTRIGAASGLHLSANVAERDGTDPIVARALIDPPFEAASGFLVAGGWTGGALVGVPFGSRIAARAGADVDLDARELVSAIAAIELHDPCHCVVVRATGAHRIGRPGVDVWISVDLPLTPR